MLTDRIAEIKPDPGDMEGDVLQRIHRGLEGEPPVLMPKKRGGW